ncbi:MAG: SDR family oxidoreductase [Planctomycetota bacterium]|nr:SDR family oxidoreductase [Planctomycetota bacterium]
MAQRTCLVIGAAGGIGRELVGMLHRDGWSIVLAGRTPSALEETAATCDGQVACVDARDFDAVDAVFQAHPGISGAVNLAGSILLKPAHLTSAQEFDETVGLNLRTAFALARAAGRHMKGAGGSVVLLSSCAAGIGLANHEAIAASKAGVEGLVRAAAATYAGAGVRFNAVAPGLVATPMARRITDNEGALKASVAMHPLGRIGRPADVARVIAFLLHPQSDWITGQVVGVDAGLSRLKTR